MNKRLQNLAVLLLLGVAFPVMAEQDLWDSRDGSFYIGVNGGISFLEPDPGASSFTIDEDTSEGVKLSLGYHFTDYLSVEGLYSVLGEATFNERDASIDYSVAGLGLRYGVPISKRLGVSIATGVGQIENTGNNVVFTKVEDVLVYVGVGAEYRFGDHFSVLAHYDYFDKDAQLASLGLRYRFGGSSPEPKIKEHKPRPLPVIKPAPAPVYQPPVPAPAPVITAPAPAERVVVCQASVNSILRSQNIHFDSGSANISEQSLGTMAELSSAIMGCSAVNRILIAGHTDSQGDNASNQNLSERRARAVADYLVQSGVSPSQIAIKGFGENRPIADNNTAEGRAANRRIEMRLSNN